MTNNNDDSNEDDRVMNDTTMPPTMPPPAPRPPQHPTDNNNNTTSVAFSASAPAKQSLTQVRNARRRNEKTGGRKGFGLSDWNKLLNVSTDLAQRRGAGLRRIRWSEIKQHNKPHDGWMVIKNKVYNVGPYLPYHPGGERVLKPLLGKDGTAAFDKHHRWINEEPLIGKLLVGYLDTTPEPMDAFDEDEEEDEDDIEERKRSAYITNL
eukprot:CAMPEP_0168748976 /NCGR_PEP_ID=MMETSP0724-20121128/16460_1 /TAXON_ID=265536 /ORGANISM="Amphiprora sp., Strain CCMP467" /LENGTH=207 /DNA_ID=CAMNT_0008796835 /DNA_START=21 /DNA_END=644 /DNA_ORIENTATION=+